MKHFTLKPGVVLMFLLAAVFLLSPAIVSATPEIYFVTEKNMAQRRSFWSAGKQMAYRQQTQAALAHFPPPGGMDYPPRPFPRSDGPGQDSAGRTSGRHGRDGYGAGCNWRRHTGLGGRSAGRALQCAPLIRIERQPGETEQEETKPNICWTQWLVQSLPAAENQVLVFERLEPLNVDRLK